MKYLAIFAAVCIAAGILYWFMKIGGTAPAPEPAISSFEECAAAGNPVMESYPRQCKTKEGVTFVETLPEGQQPDPQAQPEDQGVTTVEVQGVVTAVDLEQMMVDGPGLITIAAQDGAPRTVAVPSMGLPLCNAKDAIADIAAIKVGDTVSVRGDVGPDGQIVPCQSAEHYLKIGA